MLTIFIDESGIHKKVDHSTFVLVYIEFTNYPDIEKQLIEIEKRLKIDNFHWSETVWKVKEKFINEVLKLDFKAKIALFKNPVNPEKELGRILLHTIVETNIKNIYIDGKKPKWYERKIKYTLRSKNISTIKLKTVKGSQFAGIRIADMVAGLSRSYFDKKNSVRFNKYFKRLQKKIIITLE